MSERCDEERREDADVARRLPWTDEMQVGGRVG